LAERGGVSGERSDEQLREGRESERSIEWKEAGEKKRGGEWAECHGKGVGERGIKGGINGKGKRTKGWKRRRGVRG